MANRDPPSSTGTLTIAGQCVCVCVCVLIKCSACTWRVSQLHVYIHGESFFIVVIVVIPVVVFVVVFIIIGATIGYIHVLKGAILTRSSLA